MSQESPYINIFFLKEIHSNNIQNILNNLSRYKSFISNTFGWKFIEPRIENDYGRHYRYNEFEFDYIDNDYESNAWMFVDFGNKEQSNYCIISCYNKPSEGFMQEEYVAICEFIKDEFVKYSILVRIVVTFDSTRTPDEIIETIGIPSSDVLYVI